MVPVVILVQFVGRLGAVADPRRRANPTSKSPVIPFEGVQLVATALHPASFVTEAHEGSEQIVRRAHKASEMRGKRFIVLLDHIAHSARDLARAGLKQAEIVRDCSFRSNSRRAVALRDAAIRGEVVARCRGRPAKALYTCRARRTNAASPFDDRDILRRRRNHRDRANIDFLGTCSSDDLCVGGLVEADEDFRLTLTRVNDGHIRAVGKLHRRLREGSNSHESED